MAAYAPLPGDKQHVRRVKTATETRLVCLHRVPEVEIEGSRASACQQLVLRHDVARTRVICVSFPESSLSGSIKMTLYGAALSL